MKELSQSTSANLCKPVYDINYSTVICPFESGKRGKTIEYLYNENSFLDEIKAVFLSF